MKIALGNSDKKPSSDWVQATHSRFYKYEFFFFFSLFLMALLYWVPPFKERPWPVW
jgi:hypothetical protein